MGSKALLRFHSEVLDWKIQESDIIYNKEEKFNTSRETGEERGREELPLAERSAESGRTVRPEAHNRIPNSSRSPAS